MAEIMDTDLAIVLSKILDCFGLDDGNRKRRMDYQKMIQLLMSWNKDLFWSDGFEDILLSGSSYETTTVNGLSSDVDVMYILKNIRVIENIEQWRRDASAYTYLVDNSGCYKPFVKLYLLSEHYPGPVYSDTLRTVPKGHTTDDDKKLLLENSPRNFVRDKELEQHGPALTENRLPIECDNVVSIKCDFFPKVAIGWKERQTSKTRSKINNSIIDQAKHCYLVGVGNKGSPAENIEWRLSFSHIENSLVHDWNNIQYKSYVMMKFIKKCLIEPSAPGIICSYHFKTILMWLNEEYDKEFFVESNFDKCLLTCIQNLLMSTKNRSLPHYFVAGCNLFYGKMNNELQQVSLVLEHLLSTWPHCLFKIKCRKFGMMLQTCLSSHISPLIICEQMHREISVGGCFGIKQERDTLLGCYLFPSVFSNKDVMPIFKSLFNLKKRADSIAWDYEQECKEFIEFLIKDAFCRFGLALIRQSSTMPNKIAHYYKRTGNGCIQRYINDCFSSTCLETATHFLLNRDLQTALMLLEKTEEQMKYLTYVPGAKSTIMTIKKKIKYYYEDTTRYTKDTITHVPGILAFEFFHITTVSPPLQEVSKYNYSFYFHKNKGELYISSAFLLYYFQFFCFHAFGYRSQRKVALDNMEWILQLYNHRKLSSEHMYNIIGHCYRTCGKDQKAYWNYRKSLKEQKYHNAVIWHLAVLLRTKIRGQR